MQDQLTSDSTSLQQQAGSNLQQNSSNLQQGGTPTLSSNVFTILSQDAKTNGLRVQSAQTDPSLSQTYTPKQSFGGWSILLLFAVLVLTAAVVLRRLYSARQTAAVQDTIPSPEQVPVQPIAMPKKSKQKGGKKTTRRKRQVTR